MTGFSPRLAANISLLFTELPLLERPAAAAAAGFQTIESWWPFSSAVPEAAEVERFITAVNSSGASLCALNFFAGDMPAGDRGLACNPSRQKELEDSTEVLLTIARQTGCKRFNLLYGQIDPAIDLQVQHECAARAIALAAGKVGAIGGTILIEALASGLNGNYPLCTAQQVVDLLTGPLDGIGNVKFLFDTFHLASNGVDLEDAVRKFRSHIAHVQIADCPGRGQPGTGNLAIGEVIGALEQAGYEWYFACEYRPVGGTVESLGWISGIELRTY